MAAVAEQAGASPRPRRPRGQARRRPTARRRLTSGVAWIAVVALLLAGVVALNVAVLQLNLRMDRLDRDRARLRAEDAALQSQLSSSSAASRIEALARRRLGVEQADPAQTTYVDIGR
jgi:cell division protein FtsL